MKSHHTITGFYGEVEVEVMISGAPKGTSASRDSVVGLIDDTAATFSANLATVYLVGSETGSTKHAEQRGFTAHDGMSVSIKAEARFRGVVSLRDARTYLGSFAVMLVDRIEQYLIDKIDDHDSVLEDVQVSVDTVLSSARVLV
jgi:hypothetical protein